MAPCHPIKRRTCCVPPSSGASDAAGRSATTGTAQTAIAPHHRQPRDGRIHRTEIAVGHAPRTAGVGSHRHSTAAERRAVDATVRRDEQRQERRRRHAVAGMWPRAAGASRSSPPASSACSTCPRCTHAAARRAPRCRAGPWADACKLTKYASMRRSDGALPASARAAGCARRATPSGAVRGRRALAAGSACGARSPLSQGRKVPTTHRGAGPPLAQSGFRAARRMDE